jgi:hypothetical protein
LAGGIQAVESSDEEAQPEEEVYRVGVGDEIEEVAALAGVEKDMLEGELLPGNGLSE